MTFSQEVKSEILRSARKLQGNSATSFLTAVLKSAGSLTLAQNGFAFTLESDNLELLALCKTLAEEQLHAQVNITTREQRAKSEHMHVCTFEASIGQALGLTALDGDGTLTLCQDVATLIPNEPTAMRSFMQGLFVASGSVVIPALVMKKGDGADGGTKYHLELRFTDEAFANAVAASFSELDFHFLSRKSHFVLYLKDSERISDFLVFVNATKGKFALDDVIISRSIRNKNNRRTNCDVANIGKTVTAAGKQLEAIATLRKMGLFEGLPDQLKDIAVLREKNKEATLDEIADMLSISKSGASHRFAKLIELSQRKS